MTEKGKTMADTMDFPSNWKEFMNDYSFKDEKQEYTNGSILIPVFRVEQMAEHYFLGELKVRCAELAEVHRQYRKLLDENLKLEARIEDILKKNESLERNIRFHEGAIDAYRFCIRDRR